MPSAAFGTFNALGGGAMLAACTAALGLPAMAPATLLNGPGAPGPAYGAWAGPGGLMATLGWIQGRWNCDRSEDNRRVYIDAIIHAVLGGGGIPPPLIVTCQEHVAAAAGAGQMGHGYPDYLLSALFGGGLVPQWNPSILIEAKLDLTNGGAVATIDFGQNQLMAELVTANQLAAAGGLGGLINYQRGILTDGQFWRFYELFIPAGIFRRSRSYNILAGADQPRIVRLVRRFMVNYANNGGWLV